MVDRNDELNRKLEADLKAAFGPPRGVPPDIGDRLRAAARARIASPPFVRQRRSQLLRRFVAIGTATAAAAAIAIVVWLGPGQLWDRLPAGHSDRQGAGPAQVAPSSYASLPPAAPKPEATTILDAFALARQLDAGRPVAANWDVDGNGIVDRRDVDALAMRAVSLRKGDKVPT